MVVLLAVGQPSVSAGGLLPDGDPNSTAAILAPGTPLDILIANDIAYRKGLAFQSDETYVRSLYTHPSLTTGTRENGALFTPPEAVEEALRRDELPRDVDTIKARLGGLGQYDALGSIFIDHENGGRLVVRLTRNVDSLRLDLAMVVRHPERLDVREATVTEAQLEHAMTNMNYAPIVAKAGWVYFAYGDVAHERIVMVVDDPDNANRTNAGASVGMPVWFTSGPRPELETFDRNNDNVYAPPYRGGHGILLGPSSTFNVNAWEKCTLAFAARNRLGADAAFTAGHCARDHDYYYVFHNDGNPVYIGNATNGYSQKGGKWDYYAFTMLPGTTSIYNVFTDWPTVINVKSTDEGHEQVGYTRIKSGRKTGYGNGILISTTVDPDGVGTFWSCCFRQASYYSEAGDSGMPVWHPLDGRAWASGIHTMSGGIYGYIRYALDGSGFTLKTTST